MNIWKLINKLTLGYFCAPKKPETARLSEGVRDEGHSPTNIPYIDRNAETLATARTVIIKLRQNQPGLKTSDDVLKEISKHSVTIFGNQPISSKLFNPDGSIKKQFEDNAKRFIGIRLHLALGDVIKDHCTPGDTERNFEKILVLLVSTYQFTKEKLHLSDELFSKSLAKGFNQRIDSLVEEYYLTPDQAYLLKNFNGDL